MNPLWFALAAMFILCCTAVAYAVCTEAMRRAYITAGTAELSAVKKVGKWYEGRVKELETENQLLAAQIIEAGRPPIKAVAMPSWGPDGNIEYVYDDTGLVRDVLDPRDLGPSTVT